MVVVGCGAIGLPLAVAFAGRGRAVLGCDIDAGKVEALRAGRTALVEDGLEAALGEALSNGRIEFTTTLAPAAAPRAFIVAVPTPAGPEGFDPLKRVEPRSPSNACPQLRWSRVESCVG